MKKLLILSALLILLVIACGTETDPFGGGENTPSSGVAPYKKVDIDKENELVQPFILFPRYDVKVEYLEPAVLKIDNKLWMWFEVAQFAKDSGEHSTSSIYLIWSYDGMLWDYANGGLAVLEPTLDWEENHVGAPAVLIANGTYYMWYCAAKGKFIGLATSADGINWTKLQDPVLVPDQSWEEGHICSPTVVHHDGKFKMWYGGGKTTSKGQGFCAQKAIGYAESTDGVHWIKFDASGNSSTLGNSVMPVLTASQDWEAGVIGYPSVLIEKSLDRWIYKMWYTGQAPGELYAGDASIGFAGSYDGLAWEKAPEGINPVLQEKFAIYIPGVSEFLLYDESQPCVIKFSDYRYYMWFVQIDPYTMLTLNKKGIGLATCPPLEGL